MITEMRIVVLTSLYPTPVSPFEGVFVERRWRAMQRRGHQVEIVQPLPYSPPLMMGRRGRFRRVGNSELRNGISIRRPRYIHVPGLILSNARRFARVGSRTVIALSPDIVVCDYAWPAAAVTETLHQWGIPNVVSARGSDLTIATSTPKLRSAFATGLASADAWCAVAQHLVDGLNRVGEASDRGFLTPNGVDTDLFRHRDKVEARHQHASAADNDIILHVGHLIPRKDPLLVVRSFSVVHRLRPTARLVMVGDGPLRSAVEQEVENLGLCDSITLVGEQSPEDLAGWYAASDMLLLCSTSEGRPNVVLEALASGRPVLATESVGSAELLETLPGMVANTRDPDDLAVRIMECLTNLADPEELCRFAAGMSWDRACESLEECLAVALQREKKS
ncbi:MAG: glycosyltransferase family 4 protein [bacterium]|nr:glycosyltransferase family 4 protein [bacterium]